MQIIFILNLFAYSKQDFAMDVVLARRERDLDDAKAERKDAKQRLEAAEKALADNKDPSETADLKAAVARAGRMRWPWRRKRRSWRR
jgi:hypothetical protein